MRKMCLLPLAFVLNACSVVDRETLLYGDEDNVPVVHARGETTPVASTDDAADDPAIWINHADPSASLVLGTDKQAGLAVYTLDGSLKQFLAIGEPNNVDLRQGVRIGQWQGDLAAASNRFDDTITLFSVTAEAVTVIGAIPSAYPQPYGSCMGVLSGQPVIFVNYPDGTLMAYLPTAITADTVRYQQLGAIKLPSQLEGCVHDDATGILYFGEEEQGLWKSHLSLSGNSLNWTSPVMIDAVDGPSGTTGDIEGVALYTDGDRGYVITSSQGNDSYAVYERSGDNRFIGRFRIRTATDGIIDGAQETDGIEVTSMSIGADYPDGMLVVQDGFNAPRGTPQNFKLIDWRDIARALELD